MKICLVTNSYPITDKPQGAEYHTYHLAHHLAQSGHSVHVITEGPIPKTINDRGVTVHFVQRGLPGLFKFFEKFSHITYFGALHFLALSHSIDKKLQKLIPKENFDLIEFPEGGGLGYFFFRNPKKFHLQTIIKIHSPLFYQQTLNCHRLKFPFEFLKKLNHKLIKHMELYCLTRAGHRIAPSQAIAQIIQKELPNKKIQIIPHSIDTNHFRPNPNHQKTANNFKILTVTTLSKLKGLDLLLESAIKVIEKNSNVTFHIVGKDTTIGAQKESYKEHLTKIYNLEKHQGRIIFENYVPHEQILSHYQSSDLFVLASRTESFGLAALEAMACGLPVVAFNVDALAELITDKKTGILVPPFNTDKFAEAIEELIKNTEKKSALSNKARLTAEKYSQEKTTESLNDFYRSLTPNDQKSHLPTFTPSSPDSMPQILFLTYFFPPNNASATHRVAKFAKYLPAFNYHPSVIFPSTTKSQNHDPKSLEELKEKITLYPTFSIASFFSKKKENSSGIGHNKLNSEEARLTRTLNNFIPLDPQILWIPFVIIRALRLIRKRHPKVIFASGYPFSLFLAGTILKLLTGTPLVLSFHDPWTLNPYMPKWNTWLNRRAEHWCIKKSDACVFTTQGTKELYEKCFHKHKKKFHVIFNGFDPDDFKTTQITPDLQNKAHDLNRKAHKSPADMDINHINLTHLGSLSGKRSAKPIIETIIRLFQLHPETKKDLHLNFYGTIDPHVTAEIIPLVKKYSLENSISFHGFVPHDQAIIHLLNSDILLFLTGNSPGGKHIIAGKIFEYMAACKPIFALTYPDGEAGQILKKSGLGHIVSQEDIPRAAETLYSLCSKAQLNTINHANKDFINQFSRKTLTKQLAKIFNNISTL